MLRYDIAVLVHAPHPAGRSSGIEALQLQHLVGLELLVQLVDAVLLPPALRLCELLLCSSGVECPRSEESST